MPGEASECLPHLSSLSECCTRAGVDLRQQTQRSLLPRSTKMPSMPGQLTQMRQSLRVFNGHPPWCSSPSTTSLGADATSVSPKGITRWSVGTPFATFGAATEGHHERDCPQARRDYRSPPPHAHRDAMSMYRTWPPMPLVQV
jgi:hypothetical protein